MFAKHKGIKIDIEHDENDVATATLSSDNGISHQHYIHPSQPIIDTIDSQHDSIASHKVE